jgi:hypothetical protein
MMTGVSTWLLKKYIGFQLNKKAVTKIYNYSRIKQKKVKKEQAEQGLTDVRDGGE